MLKDSVLMLLEEKRGEYISGQDIAKRYHVSRSAVWKAVNSLKRDGYLIESVTNKGYALYDDGNILSKEGIASRFPAGTIPPDIYCYDTLDSTNNEAKRLLAEDYNLRNSLIVCNEQKKGRARYGGSFASPSGRGIYMTVVYKLEKLPAGADMINIRINEAVEKAVNSYSSAKININEAGSIFLGECKVGGILTEAVTGLDSGYFGHIIIGVGLACAGACDGRAKGMLSELVNMRNEVIASVAKEIYFTCFY